MATTLIMGLDRVDDHTIKVRILMGTPANEIVDKAVSLFASAGYFVEAKDIREEYCTINPHDSLMVSDYWLKSKSVS